MKKHFTYVVCPGFDSSSFWTLRRRFYPCVNKKLIFFIWTVNSWFCIKSLHSNVSQFIDNLWHCLAMICQLGTSTFSSSFINYHTRRRRVSFASSLVDSGWTWERALGFWRSLLCSCWLEVHSPSVTVHECWAGIWKVRSHTVSA